MSNVEFVTSPPKVFLVGKPQMQAQGVHDYLNYRGTDWNQFFDYGDPEMIVEAAGRVCYQSWNNKAQRTTSDYIKQQIVENQHGCYDEETQVLTIEGYCDWRRVSQDTLLINRNMEPVKPQAIIHAEYEGYMIRIQNAFVDLLVTPNHRMYGKYSYGGPMEFVQAIELTEMNGEMFLISSPTLRDMIIIKSSDVSIEHYQGMIHCAQVDGGVVAVRRGDKEVWCGNSVLEHLHLNFLVADLPRSTQLELVRHGDGTSFSFESTRFTDKNMRFVVPPHFRDDEQLIEIFKKECLRTYDTYKRLELDLKEKYVDSSYGSTKLRKLAKEAARSVLPNCQGSDGMVGVNARALRWITQVRSEEGADLSIREFAVALFEAAQPVLKGTLADASVLESGDGLRQVVMGVRKV